MSRIGAGKPFNQTVVLQQDMASLMQQFVMYGNSTESYTAFQSGPGEITFTRKFWPTSYIVIAVVGFFLCLIGPLILLMTQQESFSIRVRPASQPGFSEVAVMGLVDSEMMTRLMMILGQGQFQAQHPVQSDGRTLSPDGNYWWDGSQWQSVQQPRDIGSGGPLPPPSA